MNLYLTCGRSFRVYRGSWYIQVPSWKSVSVFRLWNLKEDEVHDVVLRGSADLI